MTDPIIRVTDIAFPRFQAPDLDRMETFLTDFGMHRAARTADALYMRGTDPQHHVHVTHLGEPAFLGFAFHAASAADLRTLAAAVGGRVEALDEPGGGEVVRLTDPDGRRIDVVHGIAPHEPLARFARCDRGPDAADHHTLLLLAMGEAKLGHVAWEVADLDDLMVGHDRLTQIGARHYWGIGRHVLGGQVFDYWKDPFGFTVEHWTDGDLFDARVPAEAHHLMVGAANQWGPPPPPDLDF